MTLRCLSFLLALRWQWNKSSKRFTVTLMESPAFCSEIETGKKSDDAIRSEFKAFQKPSNPRRRVFPFQDTFFPFFFHPPLKDSQIRNLKSDYASRMAQTPPNGWNFYFSGCAEHGVKVMIRLEIDFLTSFSLSPSLGLLTWNASVNPSLHMLHGQLNDELVLDLFLFVKIFFQLSAKLKL